MGMDLIQDVLEEDEFDINDIISDSNDKKSNKNYDNPVADISIVVINAFMKFTGVIISNDNMEFIINNVILHSQNPKILPSKKSYEAKINKQDKKDGKKFATYDKFKKKQSIILTLCYLLIVIQTSIPDIKTKKQFPGCKTSFKGYPLDSNEGSVSGIKFIACVISNIKSSIEPWDSIKSMNDKKINLCLRLLGVRVSFVKTGYDSHGVDGHRKIKSNRFVDVKLEREYVEHIRRATSGELTIEVVCQR